MSPAIQHPSAGYLLPRAAILGTPIGLFEPKFNARDLPKAGQERPLDPALHGGRHGGQLRDPARRPLLRLDWLRPSNFVPIRPGLGDGRLRAASEKTGGYIRM